MKIKELLEEYTDDDGDKNEVYSRYGHTALSNIIIQYYDTDCVVAYTKERLGIIYIIKAKKCFYAFISLVKEEINFGGYDYKLARIDLNKAMNLMKNPTIINKELMGKLNKIMIVKSLKNEEEK